MRPFGEQRRVLATRTKSALRALLKRGFLLALCAVGFVAFIPSVSGGDPTPITITTTQLAAGEVGVVYSTSLQVTGGVAPYKWTSTSPLPSGMTLSAKGVLSGTPQSILAEQFVVVVTDSAASVATATFQLTFAAGPSITTATVPDPVVGSSYSTVLQASGGTPPYTWSITSGAPPLGIVLNSTGLLSGIPSQSGPFTMTLAISDALGSRANEPIKVTVDALTVPSQSYLIASSNGAVSVYASAGNATAQTDDDGPSRVVGVATDAAGDRFWLATANGQIIPSIATRSFGSVAPARLSGQIVGIAAVPDGSGYWLASSTGRVYGFGSARAARPLAKSRLSGRIVAIAANSAGTGYWLASSTGHVYGFGSARSLRRATRGQIAGSVVGVADDPTTSGCWLVTTSGRVYGYGHATTFGSLRGTPSGNPIVAIAATPGGGGYWLVSKGGEVHPFGTAMTLSGVEIGPPGAVVAMASAS